MASAHAQPTGPRDASDASDAAQWPTQPVQLARGRQPRDALAKTVPYSVSSMDEFETSLREYLKGPLEEPEHTDAHFAFWIGSNFMVSASSSSTANASQPQQASQSASHPHLVNSHPHAPPGYQAANGLPVQYGGSSSSYQSLSDPATCMPANYLESIEPNRGGKKMEPKVSMSIVEALQPTAEPKDKMRKQRGIAKCCVDAIQRIDGYRYSFHNCWNSREDDSYRFSYYCNDSLLNKDRAANGKGAKLGKRATKPVYDCKGVLSIKFSASKQTLDVIYKHVPIHKTYEERAPPPRKDSKRRKFMEEHDPDALARLSSRPRQLSSEEPDTPKTKRKKSKPPPEPTRPSNTSLESDLRAQSLRSLLELIQVDPPAHLQPAPPEPPPPPPEPPRPPPQRPAPVPHPPALQVQTQPAQPRKRPRTSCEVCKVKKTKCDGMRPACQTCIDKKRPCFYPELANSEDQRQPTEAPEPHTWFGTNSQQLTELDKAKKELEEAKARIRELEAEKRASTTPVQTPQITSRPQLQPQQVQAQSQAHQNSVPMQPRHRPQISQSQTMSQVPQQQPQRQQTMPNHRQQLQQLNQASQRRLGSPQQQLRHAMGSQSPQRRQNAQQQQQQIGTPQQSLTAQQQLQAAAAQQAQMTPHNYFTINASNHAPYGAMTRPMPQNGVPANTMATPNLMSAQNGLSSQNALATQAHLSQTQPQVTNQLHAASNTGMPPTAPTIDASNPYGRGDFAWPTTAYYGYQNAAQQQQQQDQWSTARGPGVFR